MEGVDVDPSIRVLQRGELRPEASSSFPLMPEGNCNGGSEIVGADT